MFHKNLCSDLGINISYPYFVIVYGPTAAGKTEWATQLAKKFSGEIINADVGQFYTPCSIGTAKPTFQENSVPHHLFDMFDTPTHFTVTEYRTRVIFLINEIWARKRLPIIVGGSGFYLKSLFFSPSSELKSELKVVNSNFDTSGMNKENSYELWNKLNVIDSKRASAIHPHDKYRIIRALHIWKITGRKPSFYYPRYSLPGPYLFIFLTRDYKELNERIAKRVRFMIDEGWIDEVKKLCNTPWELFLKRKKLIGYDDIFSFLKLPHAQSLKHQEELTNLITQKTRQYAKRQKIFWKGFCNELLKHHECKKNKIVSLYLKNNPFIANFLENSSKKLDACNCKHKELAVSLSSVER